MMDAIGHDVAAPAAVCCGGRMPNAVKRPAPDHDGKGRNAAGRQEHLSLTIRTGRHGVTVAAIFDSCLSRSEPRL
jgi:hypothetical protein